MLKDKILIAKYVVYNLKQKRYFKFIIFINTTQICLNVMIVKSRLYVNKTWLNIVLHIQIWSHINVVIVENVLAVKISSKLTNNFTLKINNTNVNIVTWNLIKMEKNYIICVKYIQNNFYKINLRFLFAISVKSILAQTNIYKTIWKHIIK